MPERGLAPKDIHVDLITIFRDEDSRRPAITTDAENIDFVHHMVIDDWCLRKNQIANAFRISHKKIENMLHHEVGNDESICSVCAIASDI